MLAAVLLAPLEGLHHREDPQAAARLTVPHKIDRGQSLGSGVQKVSPHQPILEIIAKNQTQAGLLHINVAKIVAGDRLLLTPTVLLVTAVKLKQFLGVSQLGDFQTQVLIALPNLALVFVGRIGGGRNPQRDTGFATFTKGRVEEVTESAKSRKDQTLDLLWRRFKDLQRHRHPTALRQIGTIAKVQQAHGRILHPPHYHERTLPPARRNLARHSKGRPMNFGYQLLHQRKRARRGRILTPHGVIETPEFLPVGTQATVKAMTPQQLEDLGVQGVLANTYHLYLRPGSPLVEKMGGLHRFMNWKRPIMTDSGGFQAFSLGAGREHGVGKIGGVFPGDQARKPRDAQFKNMVKIREEGVTFRSHLDGSSHLLSPESSMRIQEELGADMILAFDECTSPLADRAYTEVALERTHRWALRCLEARRDTPQALYGIVQGGAYQDLRERALQFMTAQPWQGYAVGGSLGKTKQEMHQVLDWTVPGLPDDKPRHLLGIGEFSDLFEGVSRGIDTFDCVIPTRFARNGHVFVPPGTPGRSPRGTWNLLNARFADLDEPIQADCPCYTCQNFSLAYMRHLHKADEILAYTLGTIHNLHFLLNLMREIRRSLEEDRFEDLWREFLGERV